MRGEANALTRGRSSVCVPTLPTGQECESTAPLVSTYLPYLPSADPPYPLVTALYL